MCDSLHWALCVFSIVEITTTNVFEPRVGHCSMHLTSILWANVMWAAATSISQTKKLRLGVTYLRLLKPRSA